MYVMQPFSVKNLKKGDFKLVYGDNGYCKRPKNKSDECPLERKTEIIYVHKRPEDEFLLEYIKSMPGSVDNRRKTEIIEIGSDGYPKGKISEDACMALFGCRYPVVPFAAYKAGTSNTLNRQYLALVFDEVDDGRAIGLKSNWNAGES